MNVKIRAAQSAWSKPGILGAFSGKIASSWHSVLTDLHEDSNRGEYLGTVSSSLVYISGFWTGHLSYFNSMTGFQIFFY